MDYSIIEIMIFVGVIGLIAFLHILVLWMCYKNDDE